MAATTASPTPVPSLEEPKVEPPSNSKPSPQSQSKLVKTDGNLFPPVVITIPAPEIKKPEPEVPDGQKVSVPEDAKISNDTTVVRPPTKKPVLFPVNPDVRPRVVVESTLDIKPCTLVASEESLALKSGVENVAVIVHLEDDGDLSGIRAVASNAKDISVIRQSMTGMRTRAVFLVRSLSGRAGIYQVDFELPCGKKEILVKVR